MLWLLYFRELTTGGVALGEALDEFRLQVSREIIPPLDAFALI
jgi:hypothetical protein